MLRHYIQQAGRAATQIAFARRRFKLFLKETIEDIDLRVQGVAAATNFFSSVIKPIVINAPFGMSMLVVAPHQDDEIIGCGGSMALQRYAGKRIKTVVLQDGADECSQVSMSRGTLADLRNAESKAAAALLNIPEPIFIGSANLRLDAAGVSRTLEKHLVEDEVDSVFVPFVLDGNRDHKLTNIIVANALRRYSKPVRVFQYEVWANCIPNVAVLIDDVMEMKERALKCFKFANAAVDYSHATKGLNMMNSRLLPAGKAKYVEAFFEMPRPEFIEMIDAVARAELKNVSCLPQDF